MKELLKIEDVASYLRTTPYNIRKLIRNGYLEAINISQGKQRPHYRIRVETLEEFVEGGGIHGR